VTRAVLYRRVSTDDQLKGYSPETQTDYTHRYCVSHGYDIVADMLESETAHDSLEGREVLGEIRRMLRRREFDVLVVMKYDRLARDVLDQAVVIREARTNNARVESVLEPVPEGSLGTMMQLLYGSVAESEWNNIVFRGQEGLRKRIAAGLPRAGRYCLYGYCWADKKKSRWVTNPETGPVVTHIFEWAAEGMSSRKICRRLEAEGVRSPTGSYYWDDATVRRILKQPAYWGAPAHGRYKQVKQEVRDPSSGEVVVKKVVRMSDSPTLLPPDIAPPLTTPAIAAQAHQRLTDAQRHPLSGRVLNTDAFLLRGGFALCGVCGHALSGRGANDRPDYYLCHYGVSEAPERHYTAMRRDRLDPYAWSEFIKAVADPAAVEAAILRLDSRRDDTTLAELTARRALLDENLEQQTNLRQSIRLLKNETAIARLSADLDQLTKDEERLCVKIAELGKKDSVLVAAQRTLKRFLSLRESTPDLDALSFEDKRRLLYDFGVRVIVHPANRQKKFETATLCDFKIDVIPVKIAVNCLVIEPMRNLVCGVFGVSLLSSATP
jgi:DNA invertase Pin-like site-specific DNA recombinase